MMRRFLCFLAILVATVGGFFSPFAGAEESTLEERVEALERQNFLLRHRYRNQSPRKNLARNC